MFTSFPRAMRVLQRDGMNPTILGVGLVAALITFWFAWLLLARVLSLRDELPSPSRG